MRLRKIWKFRGNALALQLLPELYFFQGPVLLRLGLLWRPMADIVEEALKMDNRALTVMTVEKNAT
jgi:hypothetical protein